MTPEEMKNELRYLRAENAYLKAMQEHLQENSYACVCNPVPEDREEEKD